MTASHDYATTVRLGPEARGVLEWLCARYECSVREAVEGLLLGTLAPPPANHGRVSNPYGLSPDEIATAQALGISVPTPLNTRQGGTEQ